MKRISYWLGALLFSVVTVVAIQSAHATPSTKIETALQIAQQVEETDFAQHFKELAVAAIPNSNLRTTYDERS